MFKLEDGCFLVMCLLLFAMFLCLLVMFCGYVLIRIYVT